jgi:ferrochelatase
MTTEQTGIILLNMGGPEKAEDVRPFLYNLFSDRDIIRLGPFFMQKPLAWLIAKRRAPKSMKTYNLIGGGSPLTRITLAQAKALEENLKRHGDYTVVCAMRYWHPDTDTTLKMLAARGIKKLIALSLYPHYSCATTGSSVQELKRAISRSNNTFELKIIKSWPTDPGYIQTLATNIEKASLAFEPELPQVVYSAHSLPVSFIEAGDPYVEHIKETIKAVEKITNLPGKLCFQSRSGPVEWLSPSTPDMIKSLADEGCKNILMVPISFVSDHVETLYEIDMLYHDQARDLGIRLKSSESLNCNPTFINALKKLIFSK